MLSNRLNHCLRVLIAATVKLVAEVDVLLSMQENVGELCLFEESRVNLTVTQELRTNYNNERISGGALRIFLGFAIGGLLGDVFLHLLPEAFEAIKNSGTFLIISVFCSESSVTGVILVDCRKLLIRVLVQREPR